MQTFWRTADKLGEITAGAAFRPSATLKNPDQFIARSLPIRSFLVHNSESVCLKSGRYLLFVLDSPTQ
jgi:hypothetical protein